MKFFCFFRRTPKATSKGAYTAAALLAACGLGSCATFDAAKFAAAANELDPDCYKRTEITVTPMLVFGWPVPIVAAKHVKECNAPAGKPAE